MTNQETGGVNRTRLTPTIAKGYELLAQLPRIRKQFRYRSTPWEMLQSNYLWKVCSERQIRHIFNAQYSNLLRGTNKVERVLDALFDEGVDLEPTEPNPILLSRPDFAERVRKELMPLVRQCFCFQPSSYYEWEKPDEWQGGRWSKTSLEGIRYSIKYALRDQFRVSVSLLEADACVEELFVEAGK